MTRTRAGLLAGLLAVAASTGLVPMSVGSGVQAADAVPLPSAPPRHQAPADGTFVRTPNGDVYVIVGGAPVYVPRWSTYGGRKPTVAVPQVPDDIVADGTFIRTVQDGRVYRVVAGAPIYVSSWAPFGGPRKAAPVDVEVVARAIEPWQVPGGRWSSLRAWPLNDTGVVSLMYGQRVVPRVAMRDPISGRMYLPVDGVPVRVQSWEPFMGRQPHLVDVDPAAIARAGQPGPWRFLRSAATEGSWVAAYGVPPDQGTSPPLTFYRWDAGAWVRQAEAPWDTFPPAQPQDSIWAADARSMP